MLARTRDRPFPILHQLGHGSGHATCRATSRDVHIIRIILVPLQLHQWSDHGEILVGMHDAVSLEVLPATKDVVRNGVALQRHRLDAARNLAQHETQAIGSGFIVEVASVGIAKDGRRAVVGSHDDKATVKIEDVCRSHTVFGVIGVGQIEVVHRVFGEHGLMLDKTQSQTLGCSHINGLGHGRDTQQ